MTGLKNGTQMYLIELIDTAAYHQGKNAKTHQFSEECAQGGPCTKKTKQAPTLNPEAHQTLQWKMMRHTVVIHRDTELPIGQIRSKPF